MHRGTNGPGALCCDGRYRIVGQLGVEGMGIVYLASDIRLRRAVAVKVVRKDRAGNSSAFQLLERERPRWCGQTAPSSVLGARPDRVAILEP